MNRIQTGIEGFDKLIEGGFPEGSSILVCGAPGTCKTIFSLEFLYRGAVESKENGLYVTMEEKPATLKSQARQFGWDFDKINNKVYFLKIPIDTLDVNILEMIEELAKKVDAKRIVIDSLSILAINASMFNIPVKTKIGEEAKFVTETIKPSNLTIESETKQFIYVFVSRVSDFKATVLFVGDSPESSDYLTRDTVSEFVCDGVIKLEQKDFGKTICRTLEIKKMRNTKAEPGFNTLELTDKGLKVSKFTY